MNVLLINPPFDPEDSVGESASVRFVINITPPLGLAYLAAVLEKDGHRVRIVDYTARWVYAPLADIVGEFPPALIGITATTPSWNSACRTASEVRGLAPRARLLIGGAHVSADPEGALMGGLFDAGIIGEGEETIRELAALPPEADEERLARVPGIAFRRNGALFRSPPRPFIEDLDSLPFPAYRLLPPLSAYHPTPASYRRRPVGILMTSRGCPFRCTFCDRSIFGNRTRFHGPERVLAEVETMAAKHGACEIRFFDDTFTLDRERTVAICAGLERMKLRLPWTCLTAVKTVTPEVLQAMKRAGCWQVLFGLESGDDRMLRLLKKGNTVEDNRRAVRWAREAGLEVRADFIVGTPGETMESLENTLRFALSEDLDYAHFNKFVTFPGTDLYRTLSSEGRTFDFSHGCSILDHGALLYVPPTLTPEEYRSWLDRAFKRFYLRPAFVWRRIMGVRTLVQFKGQLRGAVSIVGL
ncbi:MAG: radical SAM protein [Candidatus Aureabacteria bacterium]|nr:radical SAM protein [Candidatus Auribacterota bacterium]